MATDLFRRQIYGCFWFEALLAGVPDDISAKVLHDNAARLYRLP